MDSPLTWVVPKAIVEVPNVPVKVITPVATVCELDTSRPVAFSTLAAPAAALLVVTAMVLPTLDDRVSAPVVALALAVTPVVAVLRLIAAATLAPWVATL